MARETPAAPGGTDAVRRTLDTHAVDPEAADRTYLVSMLRRLGYSESQIEDYLAGRAVPPEGQATVALAKSHAVVDPGARHVEVEYTGPGLRDYRFVEVVDRLEVPEEDLVEFQATAPAVEDTQDLMEFQAAPSAVPEPVPEASAEPASDTSWEPGQEEAPPLQASEEAAPWPEEPAEPPASDGIQYHEYTLYNKEEMRDGQPARVFAFSKTPPGEGYEAAREVPEGYEVAENPETGRPFLRRTDDGDWSVADESAGSASAALAAGTDPQRRRVRLKRVRAANREEAMRQVQSEGGNPLASVPIGIEKHLGDE
jgi:hypothetical protein